MPLADGVRWDRCVRNDEGSCKRAKKPRACKTWRTLGLYFEVESWFQDANGGVLDPNDAANQGKIEARILESMSVNAVVEDESNESE